LILARLHDPPALWSAQCSARIRGRAMAAGHCSPEELPDETVRALRGFFLGR
jgi:hypothetical protein